MWNAIVYGGVVAYRGVYVREVSKGCLYVSSTATHEVWNNFEYEWQRKVRSMRTDSIG